LESERLACLLGLPAAAGEYSRNWLHRLDDM
jgi:hypothetical protein